MAVNAYTIAVTHGPHLVGTVTVNALSREDAQKQARRLLSRLTCRVAPRKA